MAIVYEKAKIEQATASVQWFNNPATYAIDGNPDTEWLINSNHSGPATLVLQMSTSRPRIQEYRIVSSRPAKTWMFEASKDNVTWDILTTHDSQTTPFTGTHKIPEDKIDSYSFYRLHILTMQSTTFTLSEIELIYIYDDTLPPDPSQTLKVSSLKLRSLLTNDFGHLRASSVKLKALISQKLEPPVDMVHSLKLKSSIATPPVRNADDGRIIRTLNRDGRWLGLKESDISRFRKVSEEELIGWIDPSG